MLPDASVVSRTRSWIHIALDRSRVEKRGGEAPSLRDLRFEMPELVLLTLRFPFRLRLPGYYRLSGRFVMTPEAAILALSAAHYRRGMTGSRLYISFPPSALPSSPSLPLSLVALALSTLARMFREKKRPLMRHFPISLAVSDSYRLPRPRCRD